MRRHGKNKRIAKQASTQKDENQRKTTNINQNQSKENKTTQDKWRNQSIQSDELHAHK